MKAALRRNRAAIGIAERHAGIGHKQVDGSKIALDIPDQRMHCPFVANVNVPGDTVNFGGNGGRRLGVEVDNDKPGAVAMQAPAERAADAMSATGYDCDTHCVIHQVPPLLDRRLRLDRAAVEEAAEPQRRKIDARVRVGQHARYRLARTGPQTEAVPAETGRDVKTG